MGGKRRRRTPRRKRKRKKRKRKKPKRSQKERMMKRKLRRKPRGRLQLRLQRISANKDQVFTIVSRLWSQSISFDRSCVGGAKTCTNTRNAWNFLAYIVNKKARAKVFARNSRLTWRTPRRKRKRKKRKRKKPK